MRGEKQCRCIDPSIAQLLQQLNPGHLGHGYIEDKAIETIARRGLQRGRAAFLFGHFESQASEIFCEQRTHVRIVVYDHQFFGVRGYWFGIHSCFPCTVSIPALRIEPSDYVKPVSARGFCLSMSELKP